SPSAAHRGPVFPASTAGGRPPGPALALAGELVPQGGEGLVGGQGAAGGVVAAGAAAAPAGAGSGGGGRRRRGAAAGGSALRRDLGAAGRGLFLGLGPGVLDLLAVRLEAGPRLGVLVLPGLALLLVARQPFARLRVEALRVLVVALVVVGRRHAVQGRVEVVA